ncbi:MAG TPA: hypothetical protein VEV85_19050 [Bryobacteraceae bacterium]|nr:hypothetical protein [Bryobacteraceae bacterium]
MARIVAAAAAPGLFQGWLAGGFHPDFRRGGFSPTRIGATGLSSGAAISRCGRALP